MRIAVISDLHIGARDRADTFRHGAADFGRFLDGLERSHDAIVLLGDIYQCDHGGLPGNRAGQLAAARQRSRWLTERLRDPGYHLVSGNHDAIAASELGARRTLRLGRALLTHGDQFDPVIGRAPATSTAATWASGRLRAAGLRPVARWLEGRDVSVKARAFQTPEGPYAAGARQLIADHPGVEVVVFGHTHVPWRLALPESGGVLLNSGTCSQGRLMYASVDSEPGPRSRAEVCLPDASRR